MIAPGHVARSPREHRLVLASCWLLIYNLQVIAVESCTVGMTPITLGTHQSDSSTNKHVKKGESQAFLSQAVGFVGSFPASPHPFELQRTEVCNVGHLPTADPDDLRVSNLAREMDQATCQHPMKCSKHEDV